MAWKMVRSLLAVGLTTGLVAGCASARASAGGAAEPASAKASGDVPPAASSGSAEAPIRLRPGDVVRIEVELDPSFGGQFGVGEDGLILIPRIGLVPVAGRPFDAVREDIGRAYALELEHAVIRVTPLVRVAVLGEVMRSGLFQVDPTQTVADVLAMAGGLTPFADRGEVMLVRDGESRTVSIDPESPGLMRGLRSGDRIIVGRKSWLSENLAIFVGAAASVAAAAVTSLIVR
ncbi:MAG TPA: polysaccharide biosynthesis/export family protein [Longimicrobiales bacterium]